MSKLFEAFQRWKLDQTQPSHDCRRCVHMTHRKNADEWYGECSITGRLIPVEQLPRHCDSFYSANMDD